MEPLTSVLLTIAASVSVMLGLALAIGRLKGRSGVLPIRVVAVGGGGIEAANAMVRAGLRGASYVAIDTDRATLDASAARTKLVIGQARGDAGSGGNVTGSQAAAREASEEIASVTAGSELVVIVVALGGGTGSGAAPVVAEVARRQGALTMAVVTEPFGFEGARRRDVAARAAAALVQNVDALATVANDRVRETMPADVTAEDAFRSIDAVVHRNVGEILELLAVRGRINLDFGHFRAMLQATGAAAVGFGRASGPDRAVEAAGKALASTLLGKRLKAATSVLVNVTGSRNLKLAELDAVTESVLGAVASGADITFGMGLQRRLGNEVQVTLLVTGYDSQRTSATDEDAPRAEGSAPWRPVWLRRATDHAPVPEEQMLPGASTAAVPTPEEAIASSETPRTKRQRRAAARAARRVDDGSSGLPADRRAFPSPAD